MKESELNSRMLNAFPELLSDFERETSWSDGLNTGSIVIFEDVFMPFLTNELIANNVSYIKRCFAFIEDLLLEGDKYATNVIEVAVLENIQNRTDPSHFIEYMLPLTRQFYNKN